MVFVYYFLKIKLFWELFCLNIFFFVNCLYKKFVWFFFLVVVVGGGVFCVVFWSFIFIFIFGGGGGGGLFLELFEIVYIGKVSLGIGVFVYYYKLFI